MNIEDPLELCAYLRDRGWLARNIEPQIEILRGGVSNRAVLVRTAEGSGPEASGIVLKQALPKLRVAVDWYCDPARIHREADALRYLSEICRPGSIPALVFEDQQEHILAMEAVPDPHGNWKAQLLRGELNLPTFIQFADLLSTIHAKSSMERERLIPLFGDRSIFEDLRLEPYYRYSAQQEPSAANFLSNLIADTLATSISLVHGDYSPKNILIYRGRLVLLDHEVTHFGDPAFDVGFALAHFLSKANHLPSHRSEFLHACERFVTAYLNGASALDPEQLSRRAARHALACLLARVVGRSPLEYLTAEERSKQRSAVLNFMREPRLTIQQAIYAFGEQLA